MNKTSNPFKSQYRVLTLIVLPALVGFAFLVLAITGENGYAIRYSDSVSHGRMNVDANFYSGKFHNPNDGR